MEKEKQSGKQPGEAAPRPQCPVYRKCGGCQLQNMEYARQLSYKQGQVQKLLGGFGRVQPILGMENPYHYRNKVQAAFGTDRRGKIISGVYQSSTHRIVPVDSCLTEDETADRIIGTIRQMMPSFHLTAYDERTGRGFLRHVLVKRGFSTGEVMVVLVAATPVFPGKNHFIAELRRRHPEITTLVLNRNDAFTSMVLGEKETVLFGPGYIRDTLCGMTFRISPKSFYQINPVQTEVLYREAIRQCRFTGEETVLDAYCGTGTIGLIASSGVRRVTGVEINRDAVRDARRNARENGVENAEFFCADAGEWMLQAAGEGYAPDVVMMDPPRAGSSREFLAALLTVKPERIVYISCNIETQARDLRILTQGGYQVRRIQPVDMFPHTSHVETVVLLSKVQN